MIMMSPYARHQFRNNALHRFRNDQSGDLGMRTRAPWESRPWVSVRPVIKVAWLPWRMCCIIRKPLCTKRAISSCSFESFRVVSKFSSPSRFYTGYNRESYLVVKQCTIDRGLFPSSNYRYCTNQREDQHGREDRFSHVASLRQAVHGQHP